MNEEITINVNEFVAPMANIDIDDEDIISNSLNNNENGQGLEINKSLCQSLEDLVHTFDTQVNEYHEKFKKKPTRAFTCDTISNLQVLYKFDDKKLNKPKIVMQKDEDNLKQGKIDDSGYCSIFNSNDDYCNDLSLMNADQVLIEIENIIAEQENGFNKASNYEYQTIEEIQNEQISESLQNFSTNSLQKICERLEDKIKEFNEVLVQEFANRDEAEYEKETKNTFISLLHNIQNKRRVILSSNALMKKKNRKSLDLSYMPGIHLTTVIPYDKNVKLNVQNLQILNKLLRSINDDSPQVPELLTNYILNVICPK